MLLFDMINIMDKGVQPEDTKIHLATWNGIDEPSELYVSGEFAEWQRWQTKRNFERKYVLSLVSMRGVGRWLFAGVHKSGECKKIGDGNYYYQLEELESCKEMGGRLLVKFQRPGRQSYLVAEKWAAGMSVSEIMPEKLSVAEFPGFKAINMPKKQLDTLVNQNNESWRVALSSVSGVYLISDLKTGMLYVGSATGEGGIWQRWCQYSANGHGGNLELKKIVDADGIQRAEHFCYSVLEIADTHASDEEILFRESHWKKVLLTRKYGLNAN